MAEQAAGDYGFSGAESIEALKPAVSQEVVNQDTTNSHKDVNSNVEIEANDG